jgi:hypothetical protein
VCVFLFIFYGEYKKSGEHTIWEDNIKVNLLEIDCAGIKWTEVTQNRGEWCCLLESLSRLLVTIHISFDLSIKYIC